MVLNGIPNDRQVDDVVAVADDVPKTDDPLVVGNGRHERPVQTFDSIQGEVLPPSGGRDRFNPRKRGTPNA